MDSGVAVPVYREPAVEPAKLPIRFKFDPPIEFEGKTYSELVFDFDGLTGKDLQRAEKTFRKLYKAGKGEVVLPEMTHLYDAILAAQVANVPIGLIQSLPRRYYAAVRLEVLRSCGTPDEEEETTPE